MITLALAHAQITAAGLALRGGFHPQPGDGVPALADGRPVQTLLLLGMTGSAQWPAFVASPEYADGAPDPLDRWSRRLLQQLAQALGAEALDPSSGPPWWPFQRWACRAEPVSASPIGLLVHPDYGLWHAYRGVLLLAETVALPDRVPAVAPCASCAQPCLSTCPVGAYRPGHFDVAACAGHLAAPQGRECRERGCLARRACPLGAHWQQLDAQRRFHQDAFVSARRSEHPAP